MFLNMFSSKFQMIIIIVCVLLVQLTNWNNFKLSILNVKKKNSNIKICCSSVNPFWFLTSYVIVYRWDATRCLILNIYTGRAVMVDSILVFIVLLSSENCWHISSPLTVTNTFVSVNPGHVTVYNFKIVVIYLVNKKWKDSEI